MKYIFVFCLAIRNLNCGFHEMAICDYSCKNFYDNVKNNPSLFSDVRRGVVTKRISNDPILPVNVEKIKFDIPKTFDPKLSTIDNYGKSNNKVLTTPFAAYRTFLVNFSGGYHKYEFELKRQMLQDSLAAGILSAGSISSSPWLVFSAGPMGAGKSFVFDYMSKQNLFALKKFGFISMDEIRIALPEWDLYNKENKKEAAINTNQESGFIQDIAMFAGMDLSENLIIDGSLRNSDYYTGVFKYIRNNYPQYNIGIVYVHAPEETIRRRVAERGQKEGRFTPTKVWKSSMNDVKKSFSVLSKLSDFNINIENGEDIRPISVASRRTVDRFNFPLRLPDVSK